MSTTAFRSIVSAPGFALGVRCDDDEISGIEFLEPQAARAADCALAAEAERQLTRWLADPAFSFSLPLRPSGTHFQRRVWAGIAAIPTGQTQTYGQLAAQLKNAVKALTVARVSGRRLVDCACSHLSTTKASPCHLS